MLSKKDIDIQIERLQIYRKSLANLLNQQAIYGKSNVPSNIAYQISEARDNIRRIKTTLRSYNIKVDNHPDDSDESSNEEMENTFVKPEMLDNKGTHGGVYTGNNSVNIGVGNLVNSPVHVGDRYELKSNKDEISLIRTKCRVLRLFGIKLRTHLLIFVGILGFLGSLLFYLYKIYSFFYINRELPSGMLDLWIFAVFVAILGFGVILHIERVWQFLNITIERGNSGIIYLTTIEGVCPKCEGKLRLRNTGSDKNKKLRILCNRNPFQHKWDFDFTTLAPLE